MKVLGREHKTFHLMLALAGLIFIFCLHGLLLRHYFFLCDDAFISFRYLDNWLAGHGLVYNPGERVEGYTNLGWILMLAPFAKLGFAPEKVAPLLSIIFSFALLTLIFFFPRLLPPGWPLSANPFLTKPSGWLAALFAPFLLASNRSYNIWASSGLETRLFSFLVFSGVLCTLRGLDERNRRALPLAGVFFALAELTRPEGIVFAVCAFGLYGLAAWRLRVRIRMRLWATGAGIFSGGTALHFLWRFFYYGSWLPNTYYLKGGEPAWRLGTSYLGLFSFEYSWWLWTAPVLVLLIVAVRRRDPGPIFLAGLLLPYLLYVASVGGDHFEYRFWDPLLPLLALLMGWSVGHFALWRKGKRLAAGIFFGLLSVLHLLFPLRTELSPAVQYGALLSASPPSPRWLEVLGRLPLPGAMTRFHYRWNERLLRHLAAVRWEEHRWLARVLREEALLLEEFLRRGYLQPSERLCVQTAGIIPYYTGLWTLDYYGLTNAEIARQKTPGRQLLFHEKKASAEMIAAAGVDYVHIEIGRQRPAPEPGRTPRFISLDAEEFTMISGLHDPPLVFLAGSEDTWLLFSSPLFPGVMRERLESRGLRVLIYTHAGEGVFYPAEEGG